MQKIKNIIFDLGNVFLTVDYKLTSNAFKESGVQNFDELYAQDDASPLFKLLEVGKISNEDFFEQFRKMSGTPLSNQQITNAWCAMLGHFPKERIEWLKEVKTKFKVYLFSNTNAIHYTAFMEIYKHDIGNDDFTAHFIKAYYSHEMGLRKPDAASYLYILTEQNLKAEETLFVDDTMVNILGAKEAGLEVVHLPPGKTVLDIAF
ncbi:MAG: family phosphatase [Chitinophagaceae bacterium]|nr:family phosphatase [Chitinophagaceae bacterium]